MAGNYITYREGRFSGRWAVGFYTPLGEWFGESAYDTEEEAIARALYLNSQGGFLLGGR